MKIRLPQVTLLGVDCVNIERLQAAMDISEEGIEFGAVKLLSSIPTGDPRLVKIPQISSIGDFSRFCIQNLNEYVDTEYVLLIQYDGFILNPQSWTAEFLQYDYIGAPLLGGDWKLKDSDSEYVVGNGGFCLRSKKFIEASARFASEGKIAKFNPEDLALCVWYKDLFEQEGLTYAPVDLAMKFSVVQDYGVYEKPFGFHGLFNKNMDSLLASHPDFPTHFFMPRIIKKRIEKIKEIFADVALSGYVSGPDTSVIFTLTDKDFPATMEKRHEYYAKVGDVVSIAELQSENPINEAVSEVLYKTNLGEFKIKYIFYRASAPDIKIEGKKIL